MCDNCAILGYCRHWSEWCELEKCPGYEPKEDDEPEDI